MFKKKKLLIMGIASIAIASSAIVVGVTRGSVVKSDDDIHSIIFNKDSIDEESVHYDDDSYCYMFSLAGETEVYHYDFTSTEDSTFFYVDGDNLYNVKYNNYILRLIDNSDYGYCAYFWIEFKFYGPGVLTGGVTKVDIDGEEMSLVLDDPDSLDYKCMYTIDNDDFTLVRIYISTEGGEHVLGLKSIELNYTCN